MDWLKKNKITIGLVFLIIVLSLPAIYSLFIPGFFSTDDGNWMIIRFSAFYQAFRDGQFPVRFLGRLNHGYGYPVAEFLYPGFMYLGIPLKILGAGFINSIKIELGASIVFSGLFVFLWLRGFFDDISSFFAGIFYVYTPYHLYDLTRRGSLGEILSIAILPLFLWQLESQNIFFSSVTLFLLLISHNTLAILFMGLILLGMCLSIIVSKDRKAISDFYMRVLFFGGGMSAFFWFPALVELPNTVFLKTKISDFSNYFANAGMTGITVIIIFILTPIPFILRPELFKRHRLTVLFFIIGLLSIFLASPFSSIIWSFLPISFIQFPFRILSLVLISSVFLLAFGLSQLPNKFKIAAGIIFIVATAYFSKDYIIVKNFNSYQDSFYSTNEATTTVQDEYMPVWVSEKPTEHFKDRIEIIKGEGKVDNVIANSKNVKFEYKSDSPSIVRINTLYYPGWSAFSNGESKAIFYDNSMGVMELKLLPGTQNVSLVFGETLFRIICDLVSVLAFISLLIFTFRSKISKVLEIKIL